MFRRNKPERTKNQEPNSKTQIPVAILLVKDQNMKNDLSDRLLKFAVDVILYLRTVKNTVETMDMKPSVN